MVKQGGVSWNGSPKGKKGITGGKHQCQYCGRAYKQDWTKDTHETKCKDFPR